MNERIKDLVDGTTGVIGEIIAEDVIPTLGAAMLKGNCDRSGNRCGQRDFSKNRWYYDCI